MYTELQISKAEGRHIQDENSVEIITIADQPMNM